jgi:hypothetical protein
VDKVDLDYFNLSHVGTINNRVNVMTQNFQDDYFYSKNIFPGEDSNSEGCTYILNKHFYRTKNFKQFDSETYNIISSGCSFTFGNGIPEEYTWPKLLENKIQEKFTDKKIVGYNLGAPGGSVTSIIKELMAFIRVYGKPDSIFLLFPEISRGLVYREFKDKDKKNAFENISLVKNYLSEKEPNAIKYIESYVPENHLMQLSILLGLFEEFCKSSKINLLWSCWFEKDYYLLKSLNFKFLSKEYVNSDFKFNNSPENKNNIPYWKIANDGSHPGVFYHDILSKYFYGQINEN